MIGMYLLAYSVYSNVYQLHSFAFIAHIEFYGLF